MVDTVSPEITPETISEEDPEMNIENEEEEDPEMNIENEDEEKAKDEIKDYTMLKCIEKNSNGELIYDNMLTHMKILVAIVTVFFFISKLSNIITWSYKTSLIVIIIFGVGIFKNYTDEINRDNINSENICNIHGLLTDYAKLQTSIIDKKDKTIEDYLVGDLLNMISYGEGHQITYVEKCKKSVDDDSNVVSPCLCGNTYCYSDKEKFNKNRDKEFPSNMEEIIESWISKAKNRKDANQLLNSYQNSRDEKDKKDILHKICLDIFPGTDSESCDNGSLSEYWTTIYHSDSSFIESPTNRFINNPPASQGGYCYEVVSSGESEDNDSISSLQCLPFPEAPCKDKDCKNGKCIEDNGLCECFPGYYGDNCEDSFIKCNIEEDCNPDNTIDVNGYKKKNGEAITKEEGVESCKCICSDFTLKSPCYKEDMIIDTDEPEPLYRWENMLQFSSNKCLTDGLCVSSSSGMGFVCNPDTYVDWSKDPCSGNSKDCSLGLAYDENEDKSYIECKRCPTNTSTLWKINQPGFSEGCDMIQSPELCPQSYNITDCMCVERGGYYFSDNKYLDYDTESNEWSCNVCENNKIRTPLDDILTDSSLTPYSYDNTCKCNPYEKFHSQENSDDCVSCDYETEYYDEVSKKCECKKGYNYNNEIEKCEIDETCKSIYGILENKCVNNTVKENFKNNHQNFMYDDKMIDIFFNQIECIQGSCQCPKNKDGDITFADPADHNNECVCPEDSHLSYHSKLQGLDYWGFNHLNYLDDSISFECVPNEYL